MKQKLNQRCHASHIALPTSHKGITLIALVITIIVLLILAGITMSMVLGNNGIIAQAQFAKQAQEKGSKDEKEEIAKMEAEITYRANPMTEEEASSLFNFEGNKYKNNVSEVIYNVPVPLGFAHLEGTVDEGFIVADRFGNEFVWVPVPNMAEFAIQVDGNYRGVLYDFPTESVPSAGNKDADILENARDESDQNKKNAIKEDRYDTLKEQFQTEFNSMAKSVKTYGGFYVGRYETSWNGTKVASINDKSPMSAGTTLEDSWSINAYNGTDIGHMSTWYGLYKKQKELYSEASNSSVVSGMIYGSQYDAIMRWMKDIENPNVNGAKYITNSTGMGNYTTSAKNTGYFAVKNIYDLAGNYWEWTQEGFGDNRKVYRGGSSTSTGLGVAASRRDTGYSAWRYYLVSSRIQLYIR